MFAQGGGKVGPVKKVFLKVSYRVSQVFSVKNILSSFGFNDFCLIYYNQMPS